MQRAAIAMSDSQLTARLAQALLGWKPTPNRLMKPEGGWSPRARFQPLGKIADAFRLLIAAGDFSVTRKGKVFAAEVQLGNRLGRASGPSAARVIAIAIARALGLEA